MGATTPSFGCSPAGTEPGPPRSAPARAPAACAAVRVRQPRQPVVAVPVPRSAPELKGLQPAPEVRRNRWRLEIGWHQSCGSPEVEAGRAACKEQRGAGRLVLRETLQEAWPGYEPGGALGAGYWCCPRWVFA